MNLYDVIGPIMVGPSSSHTAGAVKIGYMAGKLMVEPIVKADIALFGSFLATGKGHGTHKALVAGLLGMKPDDEGIPYSFELAEKKGLKFTFGEVELKDGHPNSVLLRLVGISGKSMEIIGESLGGGRVNIARIDGTSVNLSGEYSTLIVYNQDTPGYIAEVSTVLTKHSINVAKMQLYRGSRGGNAVMVLECDQEIPEETISWLKSIKGISKVIYFKIEDMNL